MSLIFIELCAGTAALSLRLHGGKRARPPVSRMGAKTGYASAILRIMGLRAGYDRADHYVWCEPDPGCRLLLEAYRSRELATQAAEVIRGWADEEPRALWERLRAEGPVKSTQPREVARWIHIQGRTLHNGGYKADKAATHKKAQTREAAKKIAVSLGREIKRARLKLGLSSTDVSERIVGTRSGACWNWENGQIIGFKYWPALRDLLGLHDWDDLVTTPPKTVLQPIKNPKGWSINIPDQMAYSERLSILPTLPSTIEASAEAVDPREVARWIQIVSSNRLINMGADWMNTGEGGTCFGGDFATPTARILRALHSLPEMPAELLTDGHALTPPRLPAGVRVVVYIDPPYLNTTGYQHDLSREAVIQLARAWDEVGADVYISEAEAIPLGWHTTDITDTRVGQKRTFSKQQREILTHNRAPQWTPPRQESLW